MQAKINKREIDYKGQQLWLNPVDKTVYATDGAPTYSFGEVNGTPIYNYDSHFDAVKTAKDKLGTSYYHDAFVDPEFKSLAEDYVSDVKSGGRQRQAALRSSVNSAVDIVNVWETVLGKRDRVYAAKNLAKEIAEFAPDANALTFAHRLTFDIKSNWKNIVDNFLECYHCPTAHKDFCTLLEFETYKVTTHGIYSSHMAKGGNANNSAYSTDGATVDDHAVWWLWPNTCLMRYPGRGNFLVLNVIHVGPNRTIETYDFFFETNEPSAQEVEAISYIKDVLQQEDIDLVESIQRGMETPAFDYGRIVYDPAGSGLSEHGVHHFHGLVLDAYAKAVAK
jgi:hypothetical protein